MIIWRKKSSAGDENIYLRSLDQVVDAKVDVVLPSHAGHCVGHDFFAIADQDDGSGAGFIDPTAWKRMLLGKRKVLDLIQTEDNFHQGADSAA